MYIGDIETFTGTITKTILDNGDWLLEGSKDGIAFSQTVTVVPPCAIVWSSALGGFAVLSFEALTRIGIPQLYQIKLV